MLFFELAVGYVGLLLLLSRASKCQNMRHRESEGEIDGDDPAMMKISDFVEQMKNSCPRMLELEDNSIQTEFQTCIERNLRTSTSRTHQETVRDTCEKWPKIKGCMNNFIDIIHDCLIDRGTITKIMESTVKFGCGENNDGARFLQFQAVGPACLAEHGRGKEMLTCISNSSFLVDPTRRLTDDDICRAIEEISVCSHNTLVKCDDSRPDELVSSMLNAVGNSIACPSKYDFTGSGAYFIKLTVCNYCQNSTECQLSQTVMTECQLSPCNFYETGPLEVGWFYLLIHDSCGSKGQSVKRTDMSDVESEVEINDPTVMKIKGFFKQMNNSCPKMQEWYSGSVHTEFQTCIQRYFDISVMKNLTYSAVVQVGCEKWANIKGCMKNFIDIMHDCWIDRDKVTKIMNSTVNFVCGENNGGARYLPPACPREHDHGEEMLTCISNSSFLADPTRRLTDDDICQSINEIRNCTHKTLAKCNDSTSDKEVSSMLNALGYSIKCPPKYGFTGSGIRLIPPFFMTVGALLVYALL